MRIGEVAANAGVHVGTLRYYERRGLLAEPERSSSGYRAYGPEAVRVVRFVKRAQEAGLTLDNVEELLRSAHAGTGSCEAARATAEARIAELDRRIADLMSMRAVLAALAEPCDSPAGQGACPLLAALGSEDVA
ncbi:MAG: MerR family transcriptional regulator [Segniliparus sp.]|uniref:MerR family transcriptional regulator n=1 Tax=Segniliparus sp. TaxID=2804064 RepID=UPI003F3ED8C7